MKRVLLSLVVIALLSPVFTMTAGAQQDSFYGIQLASETSGIEIDFQDTVTIPVTVRDVSIQSQGELPDGQGQHYVRLRPEIVVGPNGTGTYTGWSAGISPQLFYIGAGEERELDLVVQTAMPVRPQVIKITLNATMQASGDEYYDEVEFQARTNAFRAVSARLIEAPPRVGPNEMVDYRIQIDHGGNYPDTFRLTTSTTGDVGVSGLTGFSMAPDESREATLTFVGPDNWYEYGRTEIVDVTVQSQSNPQASYTLPIPVRVQGFYMPTWTFPFWVILVTLAAYGGQRTYEKVKRDRRRYGHPAPRYTEEQKEKLEQLKERDKEKYKVVKERLDQRYEEQLEAYKERKRKGKTRETSALLAKMDERRKEKEKLRKSGIKKVKKLKKKGAAPDEIYQALDDDEREQLGDDLPEMLTAATAAGAVMAARDDDERMGTVDKMRARKAETERKRLRAEAMMLIEHRREEGYDAEEIRDELSEPQKLALGDDLEFALEGET